MNTIIPSRLKFSVYMSQIGWTLVILLFFNLLDLGIWINEKNVFPIIHDPDTILVFKTKKYESPLEYNFIVNGKSYSGISRPDPEILPYQEDSMFVVYEKSNPAINKCAAKFLPPAHEWHKWSPIVIFILYVVSTYIKFRKRLLFLVNATLYDASLEFRKIEYRTLVKTELIYSLKLTFEGNTLEKNISESEYHHLQTNLSTKLDKQFLIYKNNKGKVAWERFNDLDKNSKEIVLNYNKAAVNQIEP